MTAIYENTAPEKNAPWVLPGNYTAKLTVNGKSSTQTFSIKMDPRVKNSMADLQKQHALSLDCYEGRLTARASMEAVVAARKMLQDKIEKAGTNVADLKALEQEVAALDGARRNRRAAAESSASFGSVEASFAGLFGNVHHTEMTPTTQTIAAVKQTKDQLILLVNKWTALKNKISAAVK